MEQDFYLYYSTQRPVSIGTFPNRPDNPPTEIKNFDARIPVEDGTFMAWGTITFAKPLSAVDAKGYELHPSRENSDVRQIVAEQLAVVGPWEDQTKIAPVKRVTQWDEEVQAYHLDSRRTPVHLAEQYQRALKFPNWKEPFYRTFHPNDKLIPGAHIELSRNVEFDQWRADLSDVAGLVKLSPEELASKREDSAGKEQDILKKLQGLLSEWEAQAAQTLELDMALEYLHTPLVAHTSNEWKQAEDGQWSISNLTYAMGFKIWEDEKKPGTFLVSWGIGVNRPERPPSEKYYYAGDLFFDQNKKRYDTFEAAQKYIQGRFDLYAHLFTELCPPVPEKFVRAFMINGVLLPGYTVALPEKNGPDEKAVDSLLDYLSEEDTTPPPPAEPAAATAQPSGKPQKPAPPPGVRPKHPAAEAKSKRKNTMSR